MRDVFVQQSYNLHIHGDILNVKNLNVMDKRVTVV